MDEDTDKGWPGDGSSVRKVSSDGGEGRDRPPGSGSQRDSTSSLGNLAAVASLASALLVPTVAGGSVFPISRHPSATTSSVAEEADIARCTPLSDVDMLIVSGGDGYEDFKAVPMGDNDTYDEGGSHMLVWKVN